MFARCVLQHRNAHFRFTHLLSCPQTLRVSAGVSLVTKLKLYLEQVRQRRAAANPLWIEASEGFSPRSARAPVYVCAWMDRCSGSRRLCLSRNSSTTLRRCCLMLRTIGRHMHVCAQAITLVKVNIGLAVLEDIPMAILALLYACSAGHVPRGCMSACKQVHTQYRRQA